MSSSSSSPAGGWSAGGPCRGGLARWLGRALVPLPCWCSRMWSMLTAALESRFHTREHAGQRLRAYFDRSPSVVTAAWSWCPHSEQCCKGKRGTRVRDGTRLPVRRKNGAARGAPQPFKQQVKAGNDGKGAGAWAQHAQLSSTESSGQVQGVMWGRCHVPAAGLGLPSPA